MNTFPPRPALSNEELTETLRAMADCVASLGEVCAGLAQAITEMARTGADELNGFELRRMVEALGRVAEEIAVLRLE